MKSVAEEHGAAGVILYSDPADDGFTRGEVYPDGPWRNADGIQRGSVQYIFQYPGDPLTPGEPSTPGTPRIDPSEADNLPGVPTTPISYGQAQHLLAALEGPPAPPEWQGGLDLTYRVGPGPTRVNLDLDIDYRQIPVNDVIVEIPGSKHPEQKVVLGAHYDSWTYGTKDDVAGWTTLMETARAMAELRQRGWQPERTIVLAGWDGEEYGLLGATEWVEQHRADLLDNALVYLNMDGAGGRTSPPARSRARRRAGRHREGSRPRARARCTATGSRPPGSRRRCRNGWAAARTTRRSWTTWASRRPISARRRRAVSTTAPTTTCT